MIRFSQPSRPVILAFVAGVGIGLTLATIVTTYVWIMNGHPLGTKLHNGSDSRLWLEDSSGIDLPPRIENPYASADRSEGITSALRERDTGALVAQRAKWRLLRVDCVWVSSRNSERETEDCRVPWVWALDLQNLSAVKLTIESLRFTIKDENGFRVAEETLTQPTSLKSGEQTSIEGPGIMNYSDAIRAYDHELGVAFRSDADVFDRVMSEKEGIYSSRLQEILDSADIPREQKAIIWGAIFGPREVQDDEYFEAQLGRLNVDSETLDSIRLLRTEWPPKTITVPLSDLKK